MVTTSNGHVKPGSLPELPMADSGAQSAQRANTLPPRPPKVTQGDSQRVSRRLRLQQWWACNVLSGGSLAAAQPPSLAQAWAQHKQAVAHYNAWLAIGPRYVWAVMHIAVSAVLYSAAWVLTSPPLFICMAAVSAACWHWL